MNHATIKFLPLFIRGRLEGRASLQNILANTGWLFADRILRMVVGLFVGVWIARYLGPEQFGVYNYALVFVGMFSALSNLGLDGIIVRNVVRDPARMDTILGTAFFLKLAGGIITLIVSIGAIMALRPGDSVAGWLVGITAVGSLFQAFDTIDFWFQSQVKSKYTVYVRNGAFLTITLVKILLVLTRSPLIAFAYAGLAEIVVGAVGLVFTYQLHGYSLNKWRMSLPYAKELLADSWPLICSCLAVGFFMKIDQVMLREMAGSESAGIYAAATRISEIWYFIPIIIVSSVSPAIVAAKKAGELLYYRRLRKLFHFTAALAFAIAIPTTVLSKYLVLLLFGKSYAAAGPILAIHIWATLFYFLGIVQGPWNVTEGLMNLSLKRTLITAAVNIILNFILIPAYSGIGAAISTVVAYFCGAFLANGIDGRSRQIFYLQIEAIFFVQFFKRVIAKTTCRSL
ncbi:MAG: flippase [Candidatus Brocadiaceae bacterium]|nr:flippase [Candidatus Brocadiaceae bacterium]